MFIILKDPRNVVSNVQLSLQIHVFLITNSTPHVYSEIYHVFWKYKGILLTLNNIAQQLFTYNLYHISYYK